MLRFLLEFDILIWASWFHQIKPKFMIASLSKAKGQIWRGKCALMRKIWHILYTPHPDMWWPFFNSASAKKLAQVVNYQVQHPKKRWCWGDLGSSLLNGNEKPNQKWHFFLWSMMISDDFIAVFFQFLLTTLFLERISGIFPKKKDAAASAILLHPRYFRE